MKKYTERKLPALLLSVSLTAGLLPGMNVLAADEGYVLMNIPYEAFYRAENVSVKSGDSSKVNINYDAISSATNKVGNYGKSGGAYHSGTTASKAEDGTITAVGGENGAANKGVIWPVKVADMSALSSLGGSVVTSESAVTVATQGRGQTSSTDLAGYQTLVEASDYSYYVLSDAPAYYMEMTVENGVPVFSQSAGAAITEDEITPTVTYGTNWGDVQLGLSAAADAADKQVNAVVITAKDSSGKEVKAGLIHLYNVWSQSDMAWRNAQIEGLDGATITNIRYYCNSGKAGDTAEPTYYIYDYPMNVDILAAYDGDVEAAFESASSIALTGLPEDIENPKAQVYHTTGGRGAVYTYLTPLVVDPADDDIDPTTVNVTDGKIAITSGFVTNSKGETKEYGNPIDGTTYTISISSDNYAPFKVTAEYTSKTGSRIEISNVDTDNHISFTAKLTSEDDITGTAIAAIYNSNDELIAVKSDTAAEKVDFSFDNPVGAKTVKVMWWDSLNGMKPLANAATGEVQYYSGYVLMNIPYDEFYKAEGVSADIEYDAISSATNKVGNYGKSGGAYHSGTSAQIAEDGTVTAVGGVNGAKNEGVIWPVKAEDVSVLSSLQGEEITNSSAVTVATLGRGQSSSTNLKGYQTLTEAPDYSYYVLRDIPAYYMELTVENGAPVFTANSNAASAKKEITPKVTYGSNWGDVQLGLTDAADVSDKQINAVVITATDGSTVGLVHLYNVWSYSDMAWRNAQTPGLNGATITNIRYYCNNKAADSSELEYYIYDYPMNLELLPAYDGEVTAAFEGASTIVLSNLPSDIQNPKAQVYHTTGGRNAKLTYLTPLVVDPADDDIDPTVVNVVDGKIAITSGSVTNNAGTTATFGTPVDGTAYTIAISSDNYAPFKTTAEYSELRLHS